MNLAGTGLTTGYRVRMQIARAKIIRPPMAMVMLEGSRFERRILRLSTVCVHSTLYPAQTKKKISLRQFAVSGTGGESGWTTAQRCVACDDDGIYPAIALTLLTSPGPRPHHRCSFLKVGALGPAMPSKQARHDHGDGSRDSGVSGQIGRDVARQSVGHGRTDLRAGSRSGCFATPVGLTAVVSCGLR